MSSCENMKKGEIYACDCCGFEVEVKNSCDCSTGTDCETHTHEADCCEFECCGKPLHLKK